MFAVTVMLVAALTRAELIERVRAPVLVRADGLVQVIAACPAEVRKAWQSTVAAYAGEVCETLRRSHRLPSKRYAEPRISVVLGSRSNDTSVVYREEEPSAGRIRIMLPDPAHAEPAALQRHLVRAWYCTVLASNLDERAAAAVLRNASPQWRANWARDQLARWQRGELVEGDDETMLQMRRTVYEPGCATLGDVLLFAARLRLYPQFYGLDFCGRYPELTFADAARLGAADPRIRLAACTKVTEIAAWAAGRGPELAAAAQAYVDALMAIAARRLSVAEMLDLVDIADRRLAEALEAARLRSAGGWTNGER